MNHDEYYMAWIRHDNNMYAAARIKKSYGTVMQIYEYITEQEYFKLKLAGRLKSEAWAAYTRYLTEVLNEGLASL